MRVLVLACFAAAFSAAVAEDVPTPNHPSCPRHCQQISLQDLILKPAKDDAALPEKLLVFIPGANVPVSYYTTLMQSIQNQTNLRLWVVVPAMPQQKCIFVCPSYDCRSSLHLLTPSPPCYAQTGR